jgi:hypothetical protein
MRYNSLNMDTEGVIDSPAASPYVLVRGDHPIVAALTQVPRAVVRLQNTLFPFLGQRQGPPLTQPNTLFPFLGQRQGPPLTQPNTLTQPPAHWYRVDRGVFHNTCAFLRGAYDLDEHVALRYPEGPPPPAGLAHRPPCFPAYATQRPSRRHSR